MRKDPTEFRERFKKWQSGEKVYEAGLPKYQNGKEDIKWTSFDYKIPYIPEKSVKLTNAGLATGARISTNMLDSLANTAIEVGLPIKTAFGLATKESTLGNPTDDRSMRTLLSAKNREALEQELEKRGIRGKDQYGQHLVPENAGNFSWDQKTLINYYNGEHAKPNTFGANDNKGLPSTLKKGLSFYKEHPDKYNPGLKNYLKLVERRGDEVMNSPEVLKWYKEWEKSKVQVNRPEPYKTIVDWNDVLLPKFALGKTPEYVQAGTDNSWSKVTNDDIGATFLNLIVRPQDRGGNTTVGNWNRQWEPKLEKGLEIVSPEFDALVGIRTLVPSISGADRRTYKLARQLKPAKSEEVFDDYAKHWFNQQTTFRTPFKSSGKGGNTVGDVLDYNLGFFGGRLKLLSQLSDDLRYRIATMLSKEHRFPKTSKIIHMDDSGLQPINKYGFVPKDASNSNSVWNKSLSGEPEIWWNRGEPYYDARGYKSVKDIPRTIISDIETLNKRGLKLEGTDVLHGPGTVPFEAINFGILPNAFGWFDRIKFTGQ